MAGESASVALKLLRPGKARQVFTHVVFAIICVICLYPLALVIGISFSDETSIAINGFRLIPARQAWSPTTSYYERATLWPAPMSSRSWSPGSARCSAPW